jgi:hypothetical protein
MINQNQPVLFHNTGIATESCMNTSFWKSLGIKAGEF